MPIYLPPEPIIWTPHKIELLQKADERQKYRSRAKGWAKDVFAYPEQLRHIVARPGFDHFLIAMLFPSMGWGGGFPAFVPFGEVITTANDASLVSIPSGAVQVVIDAYGPGYQGRNASNDYDGGGGGAFARATKALGSYAGLWPTVGAGSSTTSTIVRADSSGGTVLAEADAASTRNGGESGNSTGDLVRAGGDGGFYNGSSQGGGGGGGAGPDAAGSNGGSPIGGNDGGGLSGRGGNGGTTGNDYVGQDGTEYGGGGGGGLTVGDGAQGAVSLAWT
jgi:hypothetical protein